MDEMAKHGNGTCDADKKQWKVRTKELKASAKINTTPNTDAQRKRLHPKKVKPSKLFPPTVLAMKEVVPTKLIPKSKPMTPLKPRNPLS